MENDSLTERIIGICFEVQNELGAGFSEKIYENSLCIALSEAGLAVEQQAPIIVRFRGKAVGEFFADVIVDNELILELKAVRSLLPEHRGQLINYLKGTGLRRGLLINLGRPKIELQRGHNPDFV